MYVYLFSIQPYLWGCKKPCAPPEMVPVNTSINSNVFTDTNRVTLVSSPMCSLLGLIHVQLAVSQAVQGGLRVSCCIPT